VSTEYVEHLVIGAGPAGLRAAQVLAEAGREVLVLERQDEIGPKTCAGGLTVKTVRELEALGFPTAAAHASVGHAGFARGRCVALDPNGCLVRTISRRALGRLQAEWTRAAGAEIRTGTPASRLDLEARTVDADGRVVRYRALVGADGAASAVRRSLGIPTPRAYFAGEYNVAAARLDPLRVECDSGALANGYFWVFPHASYTSIGAVAPKRLIPPPAVRRYLDGRLATLGLDPAATPFEGATLEVAFHGLHFPRDVHLAGDAAGVPSSLTAEGIYAALVTGEEVARRILDPRYPAPKVRRWLRVKRRHDQVAALLTRRPARAAVLRALAALALLPAARPPMTRWFLDG
jgi:flavin-dependent dehydrogenase